MTIIKKLKETMNLTISKNIIEVLYMLLITFIKVIIM